MDLNYEGITTVHVPLHCLPRWLGRNGPELRRDYDVGGGYQISRSSPDGMDLNYEGITTKGHSDS